VSIFELCESQWAKIKMVSIPGFIVVVLVDQVLEGVGEKFKVT
jgi:hypothetical protein